MEDWKYTRVGALEKRNFSLTEAGQTDIVTAGASVNAFLDGLATGPASHCRLIFLDGVYRPDLSVLPASDSEAALYVGAIYDEPELIRERLEGQVDSLENSPSAGFGLLNAAFTREGLVIRAGAGVEVERPIELYFLSADSETEHMAHPQIWVEADANSKLHIVEHYVGVGDSVALTNAMTRVVAGDGSLVTHLKLQQEAATAYHVASLEAEVGANARFESLSVSLGARLARNDIGVHLRGAGAHAGLDGLMLASGRQHTDFHTRVDHHVPNATSDEYYKGIFDDRARGVFNGRVYVHPGADGTDAQQQNRNLLLSRNAEVDTKPQLEIYAEEVKCSHGATVGQLDENMQFYLRSRGLNADFARSILIYGFAREIVDRIDDPELREKIGRQVLSRLPGDLDAMDLELVDPESGEFES